MKTSPSRSMPLNPILKAAQCENPFVIFTLCIESVKNFIKWMFHHKTDEKNMMRNFTPFCLQKMDKVNWIAMKQLEECLDDATHHCFVQWYYQERHHTKFSPIKDTWSFVMAILNTYTFAWWALFKTTSPLTVGLKELWQIIFNGLQCGNLQSIGMYQPDWYAHVLWWGLYEICKVSSNAAYPKPTCLREQHWQTPSPCSMWKWHNWLYTSGPNVQHPCSLHCHPPLLQTHLQHPRMLVTVVANTHTSIQAKVEVAALIKNYVSNHTQTSAPHKDIIIYKTKIQSKSQSQSLGVRIWLMQLKSNWRYISHH